MGEWVLHTKAPAQVPEQLLLIPPLASWWWCLHLVIIYGILVISHGPQWQEASRKLP